MGVNDREHYLIVDNRGYCGGCEFCGTVEEVAYCACGDDESCPGLAADHPSGSCGAAECDCSDVIA